MNYEVEGQLNIFDCFRKEEIIEIPKCRYSEHTCNKEELFKVADAQYKEGGMRLPCSHICCRFCAQRGCGARCNGSQEPPKKVRQWHRCIKQMPEKSGYYEIMDINGTRYPKAWFEKTINSFSHETHYTIEAWREAEE